MANKQTGVQYLVAKTGFYVSETVQISRGAIVVSDDPVVKGREDLFEPIENRVRDTRRRD